MGRSRCAHLDAETYVLVVRARDEGKDGLAVSVALLRFCVIAQSRDSNPNRLLSKLQVPAGVIES
eukprot:2778265-Amphidinium_carterae.1